MLRSVRTLASDIHVLRSNGRKGSLPFGTLPPQRALSGVKRMLNTLKDRSYDQRKAANRVQIKKLAKPSIPKINIIPLRITRIVNITGHFPLIIFSLSDKYFPRIASLWLSQSRTCPTTHIAAAIGTNTSPGGWPPFSVASRIHIPAPMIAQATCNHRNTLFTCSGLKIDS